MKSTLAIGLLVIWSMGTSLASGPGTVEDLGGNRVTQIAVVVNDIESSAAVYADLFGVEEPAVIVTDPLEQAHTRYLGEATEARAKLAFIRLENLTLELIEPIGGPSVWKDVLDEQGNGYHHMAFAVDDEKAALERLEETGTYLVQRGDFTGGSYAYVENEELGIVIELLTSDD